MLKLATKLVPDRGALETAYRAGFRNVEFWLGEKILADVAGIVRLARAFPNEYVPHFPNKLGLAPETLEATVHLYRELGCRCMVIHQPMFDAYHEELLALDGGLRLAVENHKLSSPMLADWAEKNPGLALDVEHVWKFTLRDAPLRELLAHVGDVVRRFAGKLRHVHLPGYWPGLDEHRPMYAAREMVLPVLDLLAEVKFDGLIVSEVNPPFQNAQDLRMDVLLFERWRDTRPS
jgi:sugar phosphate isomerase/epimerase